MAAYKRILLKLSGEALMGDDAYGINRATIVRMVREVQEVTTLGVEVAVVIGGGNIFRGVAGGSVGMDRATAECPGPLGQPGCPGTTAPGPQPPGRRPRRQSHRPFSQYPRRPRTA